MIEVFLPCILLAAIGAMIKQILSSVGKEGIAGALQDLIGAAILVLLCTTVFGTSKPVAIEWTTDAADLGSAYAETLQEVVRLSEKDLSEQISKRIADAFSVHPLSCVVSIDPNTFTLTGISIYFSKEERFISGYEIKKFVKELYGGEVEIFYE